MNAERLLANFDHLSDSPDSVNRLRHFVLDLAVRGKLVEQNPADEPASTLLTRIAAARKLVPMSGRKTKKKPVDSSLTKLAFQLPDGWVSAQLDELVRVLNGRAYKKAELLNSGTPVLRVGNLFTSKHWYYSNLKLEKDKYCEAGDLIYAWSASFGPFIWHGPRVIYHYHIWKLPLFSEANLDKQFLYFFLLQKTKEIKSAGHGVSMIHMTKTKMEQIMVPLPPLAEQHRIVAKINEMMALCDQLDKARTAREKMRDQIAKASLGHLSKFDTDNATFRSNSRFAVKALPTLTERADQIKDLRQTILNLAVRGKLVGQDPKDKPASELLTHARCSLEKFAKTVRRMRWKTTEPVAFDEIERDIPPGWVPARINDTGLYINGLAFKPADWKQSGLPIIRIQNLTNPAKEFNFAEGDFPDEVLVRNGDLLVSWSATLDAYKWDRGKAVLNQHIFRVLPNDSLTTQDFLLILLRNAIREMAESDHAHGLVMTHINRGPFLNHVILIPPLTEQHRIVAKVDELMALCGRLEAGLSSVSATRSQLLESVLHAAL